ncbi:GNAT family N-acetyltransferase [Pokkaliibacter sp. CJK22405]|uniref:GNAT family N-acetyltransferase n=1 Tax=Pokkaliibacter sp. CJK22405 TaxID=3384615 RepID=UPI00398555F8
MTSIQFRLATQQDVEAIAALHTLSWQTSLQEIFPAQFLTEQVPHMHRQHWLETLATPKGYLCVAELNDALVGFIFCHTNDDLKEWGCLIDNLHVHPDMKGRGLGRQLAQHAAHWCRDIQSCNALHLWVAEGNRAAINSYLRWGGERVERCLHHHQGGPSIWAYRFYWENLSQTLLQQE